jgi:hypothetical protein
VAELETATTPSTRVSGQTKAGDVVLSRADSLQLIYQFQTNKRMTLQNYVFLKNGRYELCITRERALSLGIDTDAYDECIAFVNKLNAR